MQNDFDPNNSVDKTKEELPPGMHVVEGNADADVEEELMDENFDEKDGESEEPPLNLNEEYEAEEGRGAF